MSNYDAHNAMVDWATGPKAGASWMKPAPVRAKPSLLAKVLKLLGML